MLLLHLPFLLRFSFGCLLLQMRRLSDRGLLGLLFNLLGCLLLLGLLLLALELRWLLG